MKKIIFAVGIILLLSFSSANSIIYLERVAPTQYLSQNIIITTKTTLENYHNTKRYPLYNYRHGYSYRATADYFNQIIKRNIIITNNDFYSHQNTERYSFQYVPYLRTYERHSCYVEPPSDRLFYVSC